MDTRYMQVYVAIEPIINAATATEGPLRVAGVLTLEVRDKQNGWVFDYEASKNYFKEWFNEIHNATDGKSWGNVRLMHQLYVAGKICEEPVFDDENKIINCVIEVTDDKVREMVQNGTLCGLSFSGIKIPPSQDVLAKWANLPDGRDRYIGRPFEVSFVDNPNQKGAYWKIISNAPDLIHNTSFYQLASLAETLGELQWTDVGPELQEEFDKCVNNLIGVVQKMAKNIKSEHKETTSPIDYSGIQENAAEGDINIMDEKQKEEITTIVNGAFTSNSAAFTTLIQNAVTSSVETIVKTQIEGMQGKIDGVQTDLKGQIETVANTVKALTEKLATTAAETTVVTREKEKEVTEPVFNAAASGAGLSDEDKNALTLIHGMMNPKTKS